MQDYLWEKKHDKSTTLLVSWKQVCQPKSSGGLGLKSLVEWNKVAIGKMIGELFKEDKSWMWKNRIKDLVSWTAKKGDTQIWKCILKLKDELRGQFYMQVKKLERIRNSSRTLGWRVGYCAGNYNHT